MRHSGLPSVRALYSVAPSEGEKTLRRELLRNSGLSAVPNLRRRSLVMQLRSSGRVGDTRLERPSERAITLTAGTPNGQQLPTAFCFIGDTLAESFGPSLAAEPLPLGHARQRGE